LKNSSGTIKDDEDVIFRCSKRWSIEMITVYLTVTPCSLVASWHCFGGACCFLLQSVPDTTGTSKTLIPRCLNCITSLKTVSLCNHCYEKLKLCTLAVSYLLGENGQASGMMCHII
jgi:hypothetical protein